MKQDWRTFGHSQVKEILEKQVSSGQFPHAYLFSGPEGVGKQMLALELAEKVLGESNIRRHPDFQILDAEGEITVKDAHEFMSKLGLRPFMAKKKIAVINNAHNLNTQSGNALLKTLEEPSLSTILILLAPAARLLPTIVSRCQVLTFNPFTRQQLLEFSDRERLAATEEMIALSFGSPGLLRNYATNAVQLSGRKKYLDAYRGLSEAPAGDRLVKIPELAEMEIEQLTDMLNCWLGWEVSMLGRYPDRYSKVQELMSACQGLRTNKNKKLVLQGLFLKM